MSNHEINEKYIEEIKNIRNDIIIYKEEYKQINIIIDNK